MVKLSRVNIEGKTWDLTWHIYYHLVSYHTACAGNWEQKVRYNIRIQLQTRAQNLNQKTIA